MASPRVAALASGGLRVGAAAESPSAAASRAEASRGPRAGRASALASESAWRVGRDRRAGQTWARVSAWESVVACGPRAGRRAATERPAAKLMAARPSGATHDAESSRGARAHVSAFVSSPARPSASTARAWCAPRAARSRARQPGQATTRRRVRREVCGPAPTGDENGSWRSSPVLTESGPRALRRSATQRGCRDAVCLRDEGGGPSAAHFGRGPRAGLDAEDVEEDVPARLRGRGVLRRRDLARVRARRRRDMKGGARGRFFRCPPGRVELPLDPRRRRRFGPAHAVRARRVLRAERATRRLGRPGRRLLRGVRPVRVALVCFGVSVVTLRDGRSVVRGGRFVSLVGRMRAA